MMKKSLIMGAVVLAGFMLAHTLDKMNAHYQGEKTVPVKVSKVFYDADKLSLRLMLLQPDGQRIEKKCGASPSSAQIFKSVEGQDVILHIKEMEGVLRHYSIVEHIQSNTYLPTC